MCNVSREWRQGGGGHATTLSTPQSVHDPVSTSSALLLYKKQKTSHSGPSFSLGTPLLGLQPHTHSAAKQGAVSGARGKKHKPVC